MSPTGSLPSMVWMSSKDWDDLKRYQKIAYAESKFEEATARRIAVKGSAPSPNERQAERLLELAKEDLYESDGCRIE